MTNKSPKSSSNPKPGTNELIFFCQLITHMSNSFTSVLLQEVACNGSIIQNRTISSLKL